jgi:hypothetical protein
LDTFESYITATTKVHVRRKRYQAGRPASAEVHRLQAELKRVTEERDIRRIGWRG